MADENAANGDVFDDAVEIEGEEDSDAALKTAPLTHKIAALEQENNQLFRENQVIKEKMEKSKHSIEEIQNEKVELQKKAKKFESDNNALGPVAGRAAELEGEQSRLQHDLITSLNDLEESNSELSKLKLDLEGLKSSDNEKRVKLETVETERNLLLVKLNKLEVSEKDHRAEGEVKEKEIRGLKNQLEDLKATVKKNEAWRREKEALHSVKNELEKRVIEMMSKVTELEKKLEEKETLITERGVDNNVNGVSAEDKVKAPGGNVDLLMAAASSVAAVALVGILCFLRFARKS
nr:peroxisomal and mitochondrial division factor 2 [Solanum lycopersicum]